MRPSVDLSANIYLLTSPIIRQSAYQSTSIPTYKFSDLPIYQPQSTHISAYKPIYKSATNSSYPRKRLPSNLSIYKPYIYKFRNLAG